MCADSPVYAQTDTRAENVSAPAVPIERRANDVVDGVMKTVADRAASFNREMAGVYAIMPLETIHLQREQIKQNRVAIASFLKYLQEYRSSGAELTRSLLDSLSSMRSELPKAQRRKFLRTFEQAYQQDMAAFDAYVSALLTLYTRVSGVLAFMETIDFKINDARQLEFKKKVDYSRYKELMSQIESANKDVASATEKSRKATASANRTIQEVYGGSGN